MNCQVGFLGGLGGEFTSPGSVTATAGGTLFVTDNQRVQKFTDPPPPPPPDDPPADPGDTAAPDTEITDAPKRTSKRRNSTFRFASTEAGSTFECSLDDKPFEACMSPKSYKVKKGEHTFEVRATDAAGNTDPTPATQTWKVKKKKKKK